MYNQKEMEAIICTCGTNLGSLIPLYDYLWNKIKTVYRGKKVPTIRVDALPRDPAFLIEAGPLLDALNLPRECCRTHMLCKVKVSQLR